jgi:hypothetical protein
VKSSRRKEEVKRGEEKKRREITSRATTGVPREELEGGKGKEFVV